ncbi:anaphase-promoting complex subunit cdc27 [Coemansia sp. RSA 2705]|nr:anaphase-promoting complex subunit cdc27 [Coemansia sp. RSA 2705]
MPSGKQPEQLELTRPQSEAARQHYERLIHRGIALLQPHSVLFIAEAYHGWYHSTATDIAGCILQRTVGAQPKAEGSDRSEYDVRSVYWLALCYWHLGEVSTVHSLLSPFSVESEHIMELCTGDTEQVGESMQSQRALACGMWLLAMACTRLEKWQEAEDYLQMLAGITKQLYPPDEPNALGGADMRHMLRAELGLYTVPLLADVHDLLGLVCVRTNRLAQSEAHSADALRRNPLLWSSCRRLCDHGNAQRLAHALAVNIDESTAEKPATTRPKPPAEQTPAAAAVRRPGMSLRQATGQRPPPSRTRATELSDSAASARVHTRLSSRTAGSRSISSGNSSTTTGAKPALAPKGNVTRTMAPLSAKTPARSRTSTLVASEKKRTRNGAAVRPSATARTREPAAPRSSPAGTHTVGRLLQLFKRNALTCLHMSAYRAAPALLAFAELPREQQNSAWGLCMLGRICFEAGRYVEAAQAFGAAHGLAPYRVRDMDTYSTLLWHMKREEQLAQLAHRLVTAGRNWSPEAWVAVANCFSLDGDHASALKSLARGIQLYRTVHGVTAAPRLDAGGVGGLAYAHTLVGHENVAVDDLDRAQRAFRTAIRIDPRHYNAWYGLGMSYLRLGKADLAEYHFKRALALNSQNPLLLQSAGAVYEHRNDYPGALKVYERVERMLDGGTAGIKGKSAEGSEDESTREALVTDTGVVLSLRTHHAMNYVMFKQARVLVVLERFSEAAVILEQLLRQCPREFNVPFLLGQTYTRLRRYREAAACLSRALDIAPENLLSVREAFDALYLQDSEDREPEPDMDNSENSMQGCGHDSGMHTPSGLVENILTSSSEVGSPYFDSPSLYAGRRGQAEWRDDWRALGNADDRVDRALEFDV